jgi:hypothetical protein
LRIFGNEVGFILTVIKQISEINIFLNILLIFRDLRVKHEGHDLPVGLS